MQYGQYWSHGKLSSHCRKLELTYRYQNTKVKKLDLMDELTADSKLSNEDVEEISAKINQSARKSLEEESR